MYRHITKLSFALPLLLVAFSQPSVTRDAGPTASSSSLDETQLLATSLVRPQPDRPVCAICAASLGDIITADDDELSMAINSEYVGFVDSVDLVVYTNTAKLKFYLDQTVVDDLNDVQTMETVVMLDIPNAVRALLVFEIDGTKHYEPVFID